MYSSERKPRILIGLTEIAGTAAGLCQGFRSLGYECDFINRFPHPFKYEGSGHWATPILHRLSFLTAPPWRKRTPFRQICQKLLAVFRGFLLIWNLFRYDVFIFFSQITFSNNLWDLPILKFFGKKIICVFVGSDSRPPYLDGFHDKNPEKTADLEWLITVSASQKRRLKKIEKYADHLINWLPHAYFHERSFTLGTIMGFAIPLKEPGRIREAGRQKLKVIHAPSNQAFKGTEGIRQLVGRLKSKGYDFEYLEISGRPNQEVLAALADCDFVIDQLYSDTPFAAFVAEAAFFGKPSVVGGYYASVIHKDIPAEYIPPSLFVLPENVEAAVESLLINAPFRLELGGRAREYVRNYLAPERVAERFLSLIEGREPAEWRRSPYELSYLYGGGQSAEKVKKQLLAVIEHGGPAALQLDDKPKLKEALIKLACTDSTETEKAN